jgi:hypothetical protein
MDLTAQTVLKISAVASVRPLPPSFAESKQNGNNVLE